MARQNAITCEAEGCDARTRSRSKRCGDHREQIPVALGSPGIVAIGGRPHTFTEAVRLADRIIDTIETARETVE